MQSKAEVKRILLGDKRPDYLEGLKMKSKSDSKPYKLNMKEIRTRAIALGRTKKR